MVNIEKVKKLRQLVYEEDHDGYYCKYYLFQTNCRLGIEKMRKLTRDTVDGSFNRWAVGYYNFERILRNKGYYIEEIGEIKKGSIPDNIEIVIGSKSSR